MSRFLSDCEDGFYGMKNFSLKIAYFRLLYKMKRFLNFRFVLIGIIVISLISCSGFESMVVGEVQEIKFTHFIDGKMGFKVYIPIVNPSGMNLKVTDVNLKITLNNIPVGKIMNYDKVLIKKRSEDVYAFPLNVELESLSKGVQVLLMLTGKGKANLEVNGHLKGKFLLTKATIPVYSKSEVNIF